MKFSRFTTPAIIASAIITFLVVIGLIIFLVSQQKVIVWQPVLLLSVIIGLSSFFLNYLLIDKIFYSHIKSIYKNILQLRGVNTAAAAKIQDIELIPEVNRVLINWENEQKQEIDHLKQLENYRREFLGNVSHELKTPIFSIQGYVHTLIDGGIEDNDINLLYLQKASKGIDRLINIVDDLESISRLEGGEMIIEPRTFDIYDLAKEVCETLEFKAKEKKIKLSVKEKTDNRFYVYADKERMRQVFINLLDNSIKYGKPSGETEIEFTDDKQNILVEVKDNGIGIDRAHLPRLFERFYRVDKSRSREIGGTGLGLAIVKHIIEAHQQKINVSSEVDAGTTFSFMLKKSK
jgi:two-component system, OmpR family, phosphate regulon sensor histidine kinase PhoR